MTRRQSIFFFLILFFSVSIVAILLAQNVTEQDIFSSVTKWKTSLGTSFLGQKVNDSDETFLVKRVVDGDTIELDNGEKVRYIGINTPESVDPRRKVECFGKEASVYNKELVEGKEVRLERDISERDTYGRLLRFVYLEDGTFVNEVLVREGYAFVSTYPPDVVKQDIFRQAELEARNEKRGLWNASTCNGKK